MEGRPFVKVAITGGTGFVGRNVARALIAQGHLPILLARGQDTTDPGIRGAAMFIQSDLLNQDHLAGALTGCDAVVHCAGINRELGDQTFEKVHISATRCVVEAARSAGVKKIVLLSFLRARPDCGSPYHESKWQAEEIVRNSGLDYTILKCGVIYGKGDHMLNHLSRAFYTFPLFAFVGFKDKTLRPNAVEDIARIITACVITGALSQKTVAVLGPEQLTLRQAVRRVANVVGRKPLMFPMPLWFHRGLGWCLERIMVLPMVSTAQVRMLWEGLSEPATPCDPMPTGLAPRILFTDEQIRRGLPKPGPFNHSDLLCCNRNTQNDKRNHPKRVFFEMP
jgi:NADH dehydrogenase